MSQMSVRRQKAVRLLEGGALRRGSLASSAKGQQTFTQTATGEAEGGYRRICYGAVVGLALYLRHGQQRS